MMKIHLHELKPPLPPNSEIARARSPEKREEKVIGHPLKLS